MTWQTIMVLAGSTTVGYILGYGFNQWSHRRRVTKEHARRQRMRAYAAGRYGRDVQ
jgi:membrane protein YqaA with SNARE-associated domain